MVDLLHLLPTPHSALQISVLNEVIRGLYHDHDHTHATRSGARSYPNGAYIHGHAHWDGHEHSTVDVNSQGRFSEESLFSFGEFYATQHDDPQNFYGITNPGLVQHHEHGSRTEHTHVRDDQEEFCTLAGSAHLHVSRAVGK